MKNIQYLVILLLLAVTSNLMSQENQAYYYKGEKIILIPDRSSVSISIDGENALNNFKQTFKSSFNIDLSDTWENPTRKSVVRIDGDAENRMDIKTYHLEANTQNELSKLDYENLLKQIAIYPDIIAAPNYVLVNGNRMITSNQFYVQLKSESDINLLYAEARRMNIEVLGHNKFMPLWFTLAINSNNSQNIIEAANTFYESGLFANAEPSFILKDIFNTNDPYFGDQWMLNNTGQNGGTANVDADAEQAWLISTGNNIKVAVLDTGFELNHPDLQANAFGTGFNAQTNTTPSVVQGNHGTACAGIIGAVKDNNEGVAGIAPDAKLISMSVSFNGTTIQMMANGINWGWQNGADVISNSWGGGGSSAIFDSAVNNALSQGRSGKGTVLVFSSGNGNVNGAEYPSNSNPLILCVGAVDRCGIRSGRIDIIPQSCDPWGPISSPGSSYGLPLDVVAGGSSISTTDRQGSAGYNGYSNQDYTNSFGGTSAACPYVAGVVALVLGVNPDLTVLEVNNIIEESAKKVTTNLYNYSTTSGRPNGTWNNQLGYGLVNAHQAVLLAQNTTCVPDLTITQAVPTGGNDLQEAQNTITALNIINSNANAEYDAGISVKMTPGFHARDGSTYRAYIDGCVSPSPSPKDGKSVAYTFIPSSKNNLEALQKEAKVYPNPTKGVFNLVSEDSMLQWELTNQLGNVRLEDLCRNANKAEINIDRYPSGIYFLKVIFTDGEVQMKTIIKE